MTVTEVPSQLRNRSGHARTDVVTHGVDLLPGEIPANTIPDLRAVGALASPTRVQWRPWGRRWIDGSYRHIEVCYLAEVGTGGSATPQVEIQPAAATGVPFALSANVTTGLLSTIISFSVNGVGRSVTLNDVFTNGTLLKGSETNAVVRRRRLRARFEATPTTQLYAMFYEITADFYSGLDTVEMWFKLGYSLAQPQTVIPGWGNGNAWNASYLDVTQAATVSVMGPGAYMRYETKLTHATTRNAGVTTWTVHDPGAAGLNREKWPSGMVYRRKTSLIFGSLGAESALAEINSDLRGCAMDYPNKRWGVYENVPEAPSYMTSRANLISRLEAFETHFEAQGTDGDPLSTCGMGILPDSGGVGFHGQWAFGTQRGWPILRGGYPAMLDMCERVAYMQAYRANEFYNDDLSVYSQEDEHPAAVVWGGRADNGNTRGGDTLGINAPDVQQVTGGGVPIYLPEPHWKGYDRGHWTAHCEYLAAAIGCDYLAMDTMEHMAAQVRANMNPLILSTFARDAAVGREFGRPLETALHCYEVTGDDRLVASVMRGKARTIWDIYPDTKDRRYFGHPADRRGQGYPLQDFPSTLSAYNQSPGAVPPDNNHITVPYASRWSDDEVAFAMQGMALLFEERGDSEYFGICRYIAADLALAGVRSGLIPGGLVDANRYQIAYIDPVASADAIYDQNGYDNCRGRIATGLRSGRSGTIIVITAPDDTSPFIWLRDCTGEFAPGETIRISSALGPVDVACLFPAPFIGAFASATNNGLVYSVAEQEESVVIPWYTATKRWELLRNRAYAPENPPVSAVLSIARYWARRLFYRNSTGTVDLNAQIEAQTTSQLNAILAFSERAGVGQTYWDELWDWFSVVPAPPGTGGERPGTPVSLMPLQATRDSLRFGWTAADTLATAFNTRYREVGAGGFTNGPTVGAGERAVTIPGLDSDQAHELEVQAHNGNGDSAWSEALIMSTLPGGGGIPPGKPTSGLLDNATTTSLRFSWLPADATEDGFRVRYRLTTGPGPWIPYPDAIGPGSTRVTLTGLTMSTSYQAQVQAFIGNLDSDWSDIATGATAGSASKPGIPEDVDVVDIVPHSARVTWTPADALADYFRVRYREGAGAYTESDNLDAGTTSYIMEPLNAGVAHDVQVLAGNGEGESDWSDVFEFTTDDEPDQAPPDPTNPRTTDIGTKSFILRWDYESAGQIVTGFETRYRVVGDPDWIAGPPAGLAERSAAFNSLTPNVLYEAAVRAINTLAESGWTTPVQARTLGRNRAGRVIVSTILPFFKDFEL